ncbi:WD40 domain-containing protein [Acaryochloris marina]|uniref:WD repeat protein n=1 Tax=Acaryochloris marina (strain MBIC 11017) TaxID=329726 RepID=A8ZLL1_ACAM1|nr:NACHT domain-containing protein [Acaryochloris marina]ABW32038.1 WD repeat protein [Acaryochloris marina MBIC11017]BDM83146.1 hypothetical protein AM10699_60070 [Acaryochloris marina MBIC10699]
MIIVDNVINAILKLIAQNIGRRERYIRLKRKFLGDSNQIPSEFDQLYAYTIIHYSDAKEDKILLILLPILRDINFKNLFRSKKYFLNPNDFSISDAYEINSYNLPKSYFVKEIKNFCAVFYHFSQLSEIPSEVIRDQNIKNLQDDISLITNKIDNLIESENIVETLLETFNHKYTIEKKYINSNINTSNILKLSKLLRGWFEAIGYKFEREIFSNNNYFEWIISVHVHIHGREKIVVRGIDGEIGLANLNRLKKSTTIHGASVGWLVTSRRVSNAVKEKLKKEPKPKLFCYTFDELIDLDADFEGYFKWLEDEVNRRNISNIYIPLSCKKDEIDFETGRLIGSSRYSKKDGWIDGYIDKWQDDPSKKHISILGEFGTGKTWFALHYAWAQLKKYKEAQLKGLERPRLPIYVPLRDYANASKIEPLFSEFFFRKHDLSLPNYAAFEQLNRMGKLLLIFDGFDEMAARVDKQKMTENFRELADIAVPNSKVILTCRTEHFPDADIARKILSSTLMDINPLATSDYAQFETLDLELFSIDQVSQVLSKQAPPETVKTIVSNPELLDLACRPIMTELVLEALPDIIAGRPIDIARVYLYAVSQKMEKDWDAERTFTSIADKLFFLCELSFEMLSNNKLTINYREFPERLRACFGKQVQEAKDLDHWQHDMAGQAILIRNSSGDYSPAHRSFPEFFVAFKLASELGILEDDFTDLARRQSKIDSLKNPTKYSWSSYFTREFDENDEIVSISGLTLFRPENIEKIIKSIGDFPLAKAIPDLFLPMIDSKQEAINKLLEIIYFTKGKTFDEVGYAGGNAATLLAKIDPFILEGKDFSNCIMYNSNLIDASLRETNFSDADVSNSSFVTSSAPVISVSFNATGDFLATAEGNEVCLWRISESDSVLPEAYMTMVGHTDWVRTIAFSPMPDYHLASGSYDRKIIIWDVRDRSKVIELKDHTGTVRSVAFSSSGEYFASASDDGKIFIRQTSNWKVITSIDEQLGSVRAIVFSPSEDVLASAGHSSYIKLWNIKSGKCIKTLDEHLGVVRALKFSPNGDILASGGKDTDIRLWNLKSGKCENTLKGHSRPIWSVDFSNNGSFLASAGEDKNVLIWDLKSDNIVSRSLVKHKNWVRSVSFHPKSTLLVSGSEDKSVQICNMLTNACQKTLQGRTNWVWAISFSYDSTTIASATEDTSVKLWNIETGKIKKKFSDHDGSVRTLSFHPNDKYLASAGDDEIIRIWNVDSDKEFKILKGHTNWIRSLEFSPDGQFLVSGSNDNTIRLWETKAWECHRLYEYHTDTIRAISFDPGSRIIASVGEDRRLVFWSTDSDRPCKVVDSAHSKRLTSVVFSSDGKLVATGGEDHLIKLWNSQTGVKLLELKGHSNYVNSLCFLSQSSRLVSASSDNLVKIWDINSGKCIYDLIGHTGGVYSVTMSKTGEVASCGHDDKIILWDLDTRQPSKVFDNKPYSNMKISNIRGISDTEKSALLNLGAIT